MIETGNYKWLDYEGEKANLKNVFTAYYGDEYKETIEERIDNVKYVPYHTYDYVVAYYNKFLTCYRKEILDNFFKITGLKRTKQREEVLLPNKAKTILDSYVLEYLRPDIIMNKLDQISEDVFIEQDQKGKAIKSAFGLKAKDDNDLEIKVAKLRYNLGKAINQTLKENPCDVFDDILKSKKNYKKATSEYIKYAQKLGYKFTAHDLDYIEHSKDLADDISVFDVNGILFDNGDISNPGIIQAYTTYANNILKNRKKDKSENPNRVMFERLRYMRSKGIDFAFLDRDYFDISHASTLPDDQKALLEKEYTYQEKLGNIPTIPTKMADLLEVKRRGLVDTLTDDCKFEANLKPVKAYGFEHRSQTQDYFMQPYFRRNMTTREARDIYFCEDEVWDDDETLSTLLHETNHAVSNCLITKDFLNGERRLGLEVHDVKLLGEQLITEGSHDPYIRAIMENVNERQAQELTNLYIQMYGNTLPKGDNAVEKQKFGSLYAYSNYITQEFYDLFSEQFKRFNVDPDFDIYFKKSTPETLVEEVKAYTQRKIDRKFKPAEYVGNNGILDYEKVRKLGELCEIWEQNYVKGSLDFPTPQDLIMGTNLSELDKETTDAIFEIRRRKDKLVSEMLEDAYRFGGYREFNQTQEMLSKAYEEMENGGDLAEILAGLGIEIDDQALVTNDEATTTPTATSPNTPRSGTGKRGKLRQRRDEMEAKEQNQEMEM